MGKKYTTHTISIGDHNLDAPVMVQINALIADGLHSEAGYLTEESGTTRLTDAEIAAMGYIKTYTQLTSAEIAAMGYTGNQDLSGYFPISGGSLTGSANITGATADFTTVSSWNLAAKAGDGNGYSFWGTGTSYKISMGNSSIYHYGDVPGYSIKTQMDSGSTDRGFTWGRVGAVPIASLNSTSGIFTTEGAIKAPVFYDSNDTGYYLNLSSTSTSIKGAGVSDMKGGFKSTANPWNTSDSAYFPNGITTAGGTNWIYGNTYIGNAPSNGAGTNFKSNGTENHLSSQGATSHGASGKWLNTASSGGNFTPYSFESERGNHSWGMVARFRINNSTDTDRPSIQFSSGQTDTRWNIGYCAADDHFRIVQNSGYRNDGSTSDGWGTERLKVDTSGNLSSNGIYQSNASLRAPIFYDSNNTGYYLNPAGTSTLNVINATGGTSTEWNTAHGWGNHADEGYLTSYTDTDTNTQLTDAEIAEMGYIKTYTDTDTNTQLTTAQIAAMGYIKENEDRRHKVLRFTGEGSNSNNSVINYGIYQEGGAWTHPYPDLVIGMHTGIKIGGAQGYNGTRFYSDAPGRTGAVELMSVGNGDGDVRVTNVAHAGNSFRAPYFYSPGDTNYFLDPASSSVLFSVSAQHFYGNLTGNASTATLAATATTANLIKVHDYSGGTNMRILGSHQTGGSDHVYSAGSMYLNCDTGIINATGFVGALTGNVTGNASGVSETGYGSDNFTFWQTSGAFAGYSGWANYLIGNHGNGSTYYNTIHIMPFWGAPKYSRLTGGSQSAVYDYWTSEGVINSDHNINAPIFYDSNDTNYYVDGASTTQLNHLSVNSTFKSRNFGTAGMGYQLENRNTGGATFRFDGDTFIFYGGGGVGNVFEMNQNGNSTARTSLRAPIFYDSNDTNYYGNFAGVSRINQAQLTYLGVGTAANTSGGYRINMGGSIDMNNNSIDYVTQLHFQDNVRFLDDGNDSYLNFKYGDSTTGGIRIKNGSNVQKGYLYADSSGFGLLDNDGQWAVRTQTGSNPLELRCNNNVEFQVYTSYTTSPGSSRAPIFYDSNNTGYYLNPASTSNLNALTLAGTATASNFILSSDERKKTKIKDLPRNNINTNWKSFEMKNDEGEYRTGVIAQELEETHPEFVNTDPKGFKSVKYIDLLIAKIAELEARLEKLEK